MTDFARRDLLIGGSAILAAEALPGAVRAAQATADQVDAHQRAKAMLFPAQANVLGTEGTTAVRVAEFMFDQGLAQAERPRDIRGWIEEQLYRPHYNT